VYFKFSSGELTVITLGPLTNLAIAINIDPDFASNVKDIYIMGGNIHGKRLRGRANQILLSLI